MKILQYKIAVFFSVLLWFSCTTVGTIQQEGIASLPPSYGDNAGAGIITPLSYKHFFTEEQLIDLIDTALLNNWDIQMALQRIQAAQSNVLLSKSFLKPEVNVAVSAGLSKFGEYTMDGAGNKSTEIYNGKIVPEHLPDYFVGLQSSWEVDMWGKLKSRKKAAMARYISTLEGKNLVLTGLIAEIAFAYYELRSLDQKLQIISENIALQQNALAIVKVQKHAGVTNELAVKQFESQLLHVRSLHFETKQQIAQTENWINFLAGRYPQPVNRDTVMFRNTALPHIQAGIPVSLLQNRPDIRQAEWELKASRADVQAAKAAFYPSLNITAAAGFRSFKTSLLFNTPQSIAYGLLGSVTAPLLNRAAIKAEFNAANAAQLEALYNYQKTIVNGYVEVYNELIRLQNLQQVAELKTQQSEAMTSSITISEALFKTARASYLEVLFTQQNALQANLELIETKKDQWLTIINIYKALGGGWR